MKKTLTFSLICVFCFLVFAGSNGEGFPSLKEQPEEKTAAVAKKHIIKTSENISITKKLKEILPVANAENLVKQAEKNGVGKISNMIYGEKKIEPVLLPKSQIADAVFFSWQNEKTVFMIENLYLYKKPAHRQQITENQTISNILHSISSLQGIEYYSTSRGKMRTLYEKSYAVKSVNNSKKTEYKKVNDDMTAKEQLALQKDLTFGEFIYKYSYFAENDGVGFVCQNLETLKYGLLPLVGPREMNVSLAIMDFGDYLLAYANTRANFAKFIGLENKLKNSFSTRSDAIYNWFINMYEKK